MQIDLTTTPFSRRGNWMSVAQLPDRPDRGVPGGLYLRNNHCRGVAGRELFRLQLCQADGQRVAQTAQAEAERLVLSCADGTGRAEIVFDGNRSVRIRGHRIALEMSIPFPCFVVAHPAGEDLWTVNHRSRLRRYQIQRLAGTVELHQDWNIQESRDVRLVVSGEKWELAVDEFWSTWTGPNRRAFDTVRQEAAAEFEAFGQALGPVAEEWAEPAAEAAWLLWACTQSPEGLVQREAVFMSLNHMDQIWSWDNCFNAAALAKGHPDLAMDQLLVFADHQDSFGAYPDGLNDGFKHYNFSKPPVQALLLNWIRTHAPEFWTVARIEALYPTLARFTQWWLDHRRTPGDRLCYYLHGNDSGWDNATMFDASVPLISPDLNAFLVVQQQLLAEMASILEMPAEPQRWRQSAEAMLDALLERLWRSDRFVAIRTADGAVVDSESLIPNMPIVLGPALGDEVVAALVERLEGFVTEWGLATERPDSPHYDGDGYWRGPVWAPSTLLAVEGLRCAGRDELADRIARNFCHLCRQHGFAENYDAVTGAARRDRAYTWTASAFLCLARELDA